MKESTKQHTHHLVSDRTWCYHQCWRGQTRRREINQISRRQSGSSFIHIPSVYHAGHSEQLLRLDSSLALLFTCIAFEIALLLNKVRYGH
jgi:hypothetical protein